MYGFASLTSFKDNIRFLSSDVTDDYNLERVEPQVNKEFYPLANKGLWKKEQEMKDIKGYLSGKDAHVVRFL